MDAEVFVSLTSLSNFGRFLNFTLIKCEIDLDSLLSKECIISEMSVKSRLAQNPRANPKQGFKTKIS